MHIFLIFLYVLVAYVAAGLFISIIVSVVRQESDEVLIGACILFPPIGVCILFLLLFRYLWNIWFRIVVSFIRWLMKIKLWRS